MAQEKQQRLDVQFPFDDDAKVQLGLRLLTRVLEARLAVLEAQRADYDAVIDDLIKVALTRIDEVLRPSLDILDQLINLGFPSKRISDAGAFGRAMLAAADRAAFLLTAGVASNEALAQAQADTAALAQKVSTILAGADPLLDTFAEIAAHLHDDDNALSSIIGRLNAIDTALATRLDFQSAQSLTGPQQGRGLYNLGYSEFMVNSRGVADQAAARAYFGAQQALGFLPVQQGGGANMDGNKLRFGWDPSLTSIRAQVDDIGLGRLWSDNNSPANLSGNGYQKLASGIIMQWGLVSVPGSAQVVFPTAFPSFCLGIWTQSYWGLSDNEAWVTSVSAEDRFGFMCDIRHITPGAVTRESTAVGTKFFAVGF